MKKQKTTGTKKQFKSQQNTFLENKEKFILACLMILTCLAFAPQLSNNFVNWDDDGYIYNNPEIQSMSAHNIAYFFNPKTFIQGNYHPLTMISFCIEYHFFKVNPLVYHLDNLLLHLMNVLLVYFILKMLTKNNELSLITALLFAIHPMRVESVAWAAERKDVLYTFFFLLSLYYYLIWKKAAKMNHYVASIVLFICSILSKGQAVVLAPVLLLIDYYMQQKMDKKLILEKIPFFVIALISGLITMSAQGASLAGYTGVKLTILDRFLVANYGLMMYLYKLIIPLNLNCFNSYPAHIDGIFYIAPIVVLALFIVLYVFGKRSKEIVFGAAFFIVTISIVLQFLPIGDAVIADRYTYIPYLGLFIIMAYAFTKSSIMVKTVGIGVCIVFVALTFNQTKVWHDNKSLWEQVLNNNPENNIALSNLGQYYFEGQQPDIAFDYFTKAIQSKPDYFIPYFNRGNIHFNKGHYELALADFTNALRYKKDFPIGHRHRAVVYSTMGKIDLAIADLDSAIKIDPNYFDAYQDRSGLHQRKGENELAKADAEKCAQLKPINNSPAAPAPQVVPKF